MQGFGFEREMSTPLFPGTLASTMCGARSRGGKADKKGIGNERQMAHSRAGDVITDFGQEKGREAREGEILTASR